jgi:MoxR-like ATPase
MNVLNEIMEFSNKKALKKIVWTKSAKRVALLAGLAYKFNEPFLLIGDTGLGKTTICQILSDYCKKNLHIINCHMHSEAADFLGSMRPIRHDDINKSETKQLFEWKDGPLVTAIKNGEDFMIDEISLADDSVLERLNSVLEEEKTLLLAENTSDNSHAIKANENFRIFATMNPSGDFGKKELSTALRNRFTEIWCPTPDNDSDEFRVICNETLQIDNEQIKSVCVEVICDFFIWLSQQSFFNKKKSSKGIFSIRDLTSWIQFINRTSSSEQCFNLDHKALIYKPLLALIHGASLIFIDFLDSNSSRQTSVNYLFEKIHSLLSINISELFYTNLNLISSEDMNFFKCGPFSLKKGDQTSSNGQQKLKYCLGSKSVAENVQRIVRCLMLDAPVMLEGSPGVGKTSIVESLAKITNNKLIRINLSEQTDLNELFGADLPTTNIHTNMQRFEWHDGPFLQGLKQGYWIILDEINLASQSVLEGLNSCFDHRNEIFISELNKKFVINTQRTKIFACQNPYIQGGGRKGLPKSFLNRFSKVYIDQMTHADLLFILESVYEKISVDCLAKMIQFNEIINKQVCQEKQWGTLGSPWEFNLRDVFRWCEVMLNDQDTSRVQPGDYVYLIYSSRFRSKKDKNRVAECFYQVFGYNPYEQDKSSLVRFTQTHLQLGQSILKYDQHQNKLRKLDVYVFTESNLKYLEAMCKCLEMNWMTILVGKSCTGKTALVRMLSQIMDKSLVEYSVNNSTDTSDLLGGFEKITHLKKNIQYIDEIIHESYLTRVFKLDGTVSESLKNYFDYVFASKNLFKSLLKLEENLDDDLKKAVKLFQENLSKLKELKLISHETLEKTLKLIKELKLVRKSDSVKFEWVDSSLVKAIENGDWVLIDNANFCAASVLDRLNPLLEMNGSLQISEKNATIQPHKDFRIFLSVNESFGELSRPMRNRGVEIYLSELDPIEDKQDIKLILHSRFPFSETTKEIDFLYEKIIDEKEIDFKKMRIKKISFVDVLKIFKLTYDFWLIDDMKNVRKKAKNQDFLMKCFRHTLQELHLYEEKMEIAEVTEAASKTYEDSLFYFSDVLKLKDFHLYKFLYDMPLFTKFILDMNHFLKSHHNSSNTHDLENSSTLLKTSIKTTQIIQLWLKNIPIKHIDSVIKFTQLNLSSNKTFKISKEKKEAFFTELCSVVLANPMFELYSKTLVDLSQEISLDITHETLNISSNRFLCDKIALFNQDFVNHLCSVSAVLNLITELNLSKFRITTGYRVQDDSLLSNIKKLNFDFDLARTLNENCQLNEPENPKKKSSSHTNQSKYLLLIEDFLDKFLSEMTSNLTSSINKNRDYVLTTNKDETLQILKECIYLLEKFYLICSCSFDLVLTLPYLKYYWSFLNNSLKNVQEIFFKSQTWSNELRSLTSLFNKNLFFDDTIYKIYFSMWQSIRPSFEIKNSEILNSISKLNSNLIHLNTIIDKQMSGSKFYNLLKHFFNHQINSTNQSSLTFISDNFLVEDLDCCNENLETISEKDTDLSLRKLFIDAQMAPLYHYVNTLNELKLIVSDNNDIVVPNINFCHLITKNFKLGKFYSIFKKMSIRCFSFGDLFYEGLKSYRMSDEQNKDSTIFTEFRRFSNETSSMSKLNSISIASFIHSNWLDEYLSKIYMCKLNKESNKNTSNYIFSIELVLNLFDRKLLKFNEMNTYLWSNFDFLVKSCSNANVKAIDENLVANLKLCVDDFKHKHFDNNEQAFLSYLKAKNFNYTDMFRLNSNRGSVLIELIILGSILAHMFSPMDPMDPLEYEILIKKTRMDTLELENNQLSLEKLNNSKLKSLQNNAETTETAEIVENISIRESKAEYFLIKNEFDSILKQLCSFNQLKKLIENFDLNKRNEKESNNIEIEFQTWFTSLDRFTQKISDTHYSYYDIVYLPLNGLALIGYGMNALYTYWKSQTNLEKSNESVSLITLLYEYPYKQDHVLIAEQLNTMSEKICDPGLELTNENLANVDKLVSLIDFELMDELNFLSLLHLFNDNQAIKNKNKVLLKLCNYYSKRFKIFNRLKMQKDTVETFKYKAYGQKEIEEELERVEIEKAYPSYSKHFEDLLPVNVLEQIITGNDEQINDDMYMSSDEQARANEEKYLLANHILPKTFDVIELILNDFSVHADQVSNFLNLCYF